MRGDRMCIPVRSGSRCDVDGIIHDRYFQNEKTIRGFREASHRPDKSGRISRFDADPDGTAVLLLLLTWLHACCGSGSRSIFCATSLATG